MTVTTEDREPATVTEPVGVDDVILTYFREHWLAPFHQDGIAEIGHDVGSEIAGISLAESSRSR